MTTKSLGHLTTTARIIPLAAAIAAAAVGTAHASERLDVASAYSTQNLFGQSAKNISERIKMMSSGEFEFAVHDPGELVPLSRLVPSPPAGPASPIFPATCPLPISMALYPLAHPQRQCSPGRLLAKEASCCRRRWTLITSSSWLAPTYPKSQAAGSTRKSTAPMT